MGSPPRLLAGALETIFDELSPSMYLRYIQSTVSKFSLYHSVSFVLVPTMLLMIHLYTSNLPGRLGVVSNGVHGEVEDSSPGQDFLVSQLEDPFVTTSNSVCNLVSTSSHNACPTEKQQLEEDSTHAWEMSRIEQKEDLPTSPVPSLSLTEDWSPKLSRGISSSTHTDISMQPSGPQVHVYCTHVEQKVSKAGLVSNITRPSFHVTAAQFPQVQTAFAASSERAFFNSQQEHSASPIVRDPRCLDIQYRLAAATDAQVSDEINFDDMIATIRRNRKAGRDSTVHVHVIRVRDIVPSVILSYIYHGRHDPSAASAIFTYPGNDGNHSTKIIDFRRHLIRVKHLSADTILWDCARHIVRSIKQDHGIVLQAKDLAIEISGPGGADGGMQSVKMDSSDLVRSWKRNALPTLLQRNGNVVQLSVSAFKKYDTTVMTSGIS